MITSCKINFLIKEGKVKIKGKQKLKPSILLKGGENNMGLKPGAKRVAKSTGKLDQRRRDNKSTPGNKPSLKSSKSSKK